MGRPFSHVYFMYQEPQFSDRTVSQETGHGCAAMAENSFLRINQVVKEVKLEISDELYARIMQDCHDYAGTSYGYLQNLGIGLVRLAAKVGIKIGRNPIDDGMNCSEWAYLILREIYGEWTDKDRNLIGPDDIYAFLESKGLS
jgi:hypothetical protein